MDPTLTIHDSLSNKQPRSKPGRRGYIMPYGNVSARKQKGIYLSRVSCDMVTQLSIVTGKTESAIHEDAIRDHFMKVKASYEAANLSWTKILEAHCYVMPQWQR